MQRWLLLLLTLQPASFCSLGLSQHHCLVKCSHRNNGIPFSLPFSFPYALQKHIRWQFSAPRKGCFWPRWLQVVVQPVPRNGCRFLPGPPRARPRCSGRELPAPPLPLVAGRHAQLSRSLLRGGCQLRAFSPCSECTREIGTFGFGTVYSPLRNSTFIFIFSPSRFSPGSA